MKNTVIPERNQHLQNYERRMACTILLLTFIVRLIHSDAVAAQSTTIPVPASSISGHMNRNKIRSSSSTAKLRTEAILSKDVSAFGIPVEQSLDVKDVLKRIPVVVFFDRNLEGYFDDASEIELRGRVSMRRSLSHALAQHEITYMVNTDGSVSLISEDDENEPEYMRTITYDVTPITNSIGRSYELGSLLLQTVASDSWEQNGGGNATIAFYRHNGRILASINQSYRIHSELWSQLNSMLTLGGPSLNNLEPSTRTADTATSNWHSSSVVGVPSNRTKSAMRSRRGFARPGSGTAGGFGGGGNSGGIF